jgi:O-antigen chain-terminating methyltransferase
VKRSLAEGGRDRPQLRLHQADQNAQASRKAGELLHSEELRFLNTNYSFSAKLSFDSLASHRPGVIGRAIVAAKRKLIRIIFDSLLKDYFAAERDFNANVVRFLNDVSKYVDARDASNFWELIRKIDVDTTKAMERIERISDEHMASLRSSEKQLLEELYRSLGEVNGHLTKLQGSSEKHEVALQAVDSVARGIEGALARISKTSESTAGASAMQSSSAVVASGSVPDQSYLMLENRFRGSEAEISKRMQVYPPLFMRASLPVLEIGPGRGELQLLFKELGVSSYGVDMDEAMVECAKERGVDARLGDGLKHLAEIPDRSLGGVIAIQVVEHLTRTQLHQLMELCSKKVVAGGKVVFETINPQSVTALSSNYFRDPTHVWPLHPDTLSYMMTLAGLDVKEVRMLSPVSDEAQLKPVPVHEYMTPRWMETVGVFNRNIAQLNALLYGHQDYAAIAEVR